jgi:RNA polymerase sigma factor (sigma-70 family)
VSTFTWSATGHHDVARLVIAAAGGDERAWDGLVERFGGLIQSVTRSYRLRPSDAEDVIQTTWLRFYESLHRLRQPGGAGAWLATTARHECLRVVRRAGRELPTDRTTALEQPEHAPRFEDAVLEPDRDGLFWEAFAGLPPRGQQLLRLLMAEPSPSYEQVSAQLGMPIGSIGPTRGRLVQKLRRTIEELDPELAYAC